MRIEQTEIVIGLRGRPLEQTERANERPRKTPAADRKIQDRALGRSAVESGLRDGHLAHRVLLHAGLAGAHAVRSDGNARCCTAAMTMAVPRLRFLKDGDEHRRNILQTIFRFGAIEKGGVLPEFICHLINDEGAARAQRLIVSCEAERASS